ncbi:MAG: gliding motility-associated C-terminal domain-containing protein, partial [Saprospiraceae bacterium]|nr:gliding motility-associated C-terminal domain-containing protein [Saprospiraceae bacterium]
MVLKREGIFVPTGFTPNGDGNNDLLLVHGLDDVNINLFRLYDRWGELIYQAENFKTNQTTLGWDGNFRGKPMPTDTYIWYLEAEYEDGRTEKQHGESTLIR